MWKDKIDFEIIDLFLDRLFESCGCSLFVFERILMDYGMESIKVFPLNIEDIDCTEDCPHLEELDDEIEVLESRLKQKSNDSKRNNKLYLDEKAKLKKFKKNSVVFSMDVDEF